VGVSESSSEGVWLIMAPRINVPTWNGEAKEAFEVWRLRKGQRLAVCAVWTHPIGGEARISVDGEFLRSEAKRNGLELVDLALEWKQQFQEKGWTQ
jgi:hypothetical protein